MFDYLLGGEFSSHRETAPGTNQRISRPDIAGIKNRENWITYIERFCNGEIATVSAHVSLHGLYLYISTTICFKECVP